MKWKFQTSGASLDAVPVYDYVVRGLVLKPATPSDAKIHRDAQNNALVEWRRRGRINYHWRDRAGVPVSEESEYYEIEVLSGSTVVNTYRIPVNQAQPVQWEPFRGPVSAITIDADGSGTIHGAAGAGSANYGSKQRMDGDFVFEFETYHNGTNLLYLPFITMVETAYDRAGGNSLGLVFGITPDYQAALSTQSGLSFRDIKAGDRFALEHVKGRTRFYKNPTGSGSEIWYEEAVAETSSPYWILIVFQDNSGLRNPKLLRFTPDWTYTADMQTADGLTPGDPIHLKIYQVSAQVGRGLPLDVTL
jgi:hypothetical protein